ncbi:hypothetical protein Dimus_002791 [Dionaea muscipula]
MTTPYARCCIFLHNSLQNDNIESGSIQLYLVPAYDSHQSASEILRGIVLLQTHGMESVNQSFLLWFDDQRTQTEAAVYYATKEMYCVIWIMEQIDACVFVYIHNLYSEVSWFFL